MCRRATRSKNAHASRVRNLYDITEEEYEAIVAHQGGVCAMCKKPRRYRLNVDHDHKIERERGVRESVRGGLCRRCNKLLRDCGDNIELLEAAIGYLRNPPARKVLDEC